MLKTLVSSACFFCSRGGLCVLCSNPNNNTSRESIVKTLEAPTIVIDPDTSTLIPNDAVHPKKLT
jgi:hypothetical protein